MNIFVCLDENHGMMFNKRRQSSDRIVRENMLKSIADRPLWVNNYSAKQFKDEEMQQLIVDDDCLLHAEENDFVFIENMKTADFLPKIEQIIVYHWNRKYPADFFFDIDIASLNWELCSTEEFAGHSHECIRKEIYRRRS